MLKDINKIKKIVLFLFFASGFAGLVYQVIWMRQLTLIFGSTVYATSAVLTSFMAGLALGSFYLGKIADKSKSPIKIYAFLEIIIGIYALILPVLFKIAGTINIGLFRHFESNMWILSYIRFPLVLLLLLVPTFLMGGTLPVISKFFVKDMRKIGRNLGLLYGINTFGAAVGSFVTGFFLISTIGIINTNYLAVTINLIVGIVIFVLQRGSGPVSVNKLELDEESFTSPTYSKSIIYLVLISIGLSGFAALSYEVLWARSIIYIIGNSVYAFSIMLTTFLLGIAGGSFIIRYFIDRKINLLRLFGIIQILIGVLTLITFPLFPRFWKFYGFLSGLLHRFPSWTMISIVHFIIAFLIMFLPALLMGAAFPLANKICVKDFKKLGSNIGNVYASNTTGSIIGSFLTGFVFVPLIGLRASVLLVISINILIGYSVIVVVFIRQYARKGAVERSAFLLTGVFVVYMILIKGQYLGSHPGVVYYKDDIAATIKVDIMDGRKRLVTDNIYIQGTTTHDKLADVRRLGYLPMLLYPEARTMLHIGLGTGITIGASTQFDLEKIDVVEIIPSLVEAVQYFSNENHNLLSNPKVRLIVADGRNYIQATDNKYDIIMTDLFFPDSAGTGNLYSREHYSNCKQKLNADGIMVQWIPLHQMLLKELKVIIKTFNTVFPHTTIWWGTTCDSFPTLALIGSDRKMSIKLSELTETLQDVRNLDELKELRMDGPFTILSNYIMNEKDIIKYVGDAPINTDEYPYIEFSSPKIYAPESKTISQNLISLNEFRVSPTNVLDKSGYIGKDDIKHLEENFTSKTLIVEGIILSVIGRQEQAISKFSEALKYHPANPEALYLIDYYNKRRVNIK